MTSYHYALNNPIMFNDPMGDLVGGGGLPVSALIESDRDPGITGLMA